MSVGEQLATKRLNEGMTPNALGGHIGITGQTIRRVEAGTAPDPTPFVKKAIADYLGAKVTDLWPIGETADV